jgi:septum formation protein
MLLRQAGLPFATRPPEIDEEADLPPHVIDRVRELAQRKLQAVLSEAANYNWVLGCDTLVAIGDRILGKPRDGRDARRMLDKLSGRTHHVHTGLALRNQRTGQTRINHATTEVTFRPLADKELERYLATGEWQGVAGAYRIQETGETLIQGIRGSYSNVVGLPLSLLCDMLSADQYPFGLMARGGD